jgi:hypothetical protein
MRLLNQFTFSSNKVGRDNLEGAVGSRAVGSRYVLVFQPKLIVRITSGQWRNIDYHYVGFENWCE